MTGVSGLENFGHLPCAELCECDFTVCVRTGVVCRLWGWPWGGGNFCNFLSGASGSLCLRGR